MLFRSIVYLNGDSQCHKRGVPGVGSRERSGVIFADVGRGQGILGGCPLPRPLLTSPFLLFSSKLFDIWLMFSMYFLLCSLFPSILCYAAIMVWLCLQYSTN
jgi:hypothetical protein